jgi:hypothetical protein
MVDPSKDVPQKAVLRIYEILVWIRIKSNKEVTEE